MRRNLTAATDRSLHQLLPHVSKSQAVRTLETLQTLLSNIISPPNPAQALKYRQLRLSNRLVSREIVSPANGAARDFLVLCGFRREVREFEEMLVWKQGEGGKQLFKLRCGKKVVEDRIKLAKEAEERETRYRESEKEAEQGQSPVDSVPFPPAPCKAWHTGWAGGHQLVINSLPHRSSQSQSAARVRRRPSRPRRARREG